MRTRAPYRPLLVLLAVALVLAAAGCDTSFSAFEESERRFSVFGYLDGRADTQFVRVEALQDSVLAGSGGPLDARVTTENLSTGETTTWRDSTTQIGGTGVLVHNFWTTASVEPGETYRFRVERQSDGAASTAEVTLPESFPPLTRSGMPVLESCSEQDSIPPVEVQAREVERLGAAVVRYDYLECRPAPDGEVCQRTQKAVSHLPDTSRTADGSYRVLIEWVEDIGCPREIYSFEVVFASVSDDWPAYGGLVPDPGQAGASGAPLPPPGRYSNIENGTGFLGGAVIRTITVPVEETAPTE